MTGPRQPVPQRADHQTARGLSRTLKTRIKVVEMRDPIAAIDVDKAADYSLVNEILDGRA